MSPEQLIEKMNNVPFVDYDTPDYAGVLRIVLQAIKDGEVFENHSECRDANCPCNCESLYYKPSFEKWMENK